MSMPIHALKASLWKSFVFVSKSLLWHALLFSISEGYMMGEIVFCYAVILCAYEISPRLA